MSVSIVIPWRTDHGWRERVFQWILPRWEETGLEIVVSSDGEAGPFNRARALNKGFKRALNDRIAIFDADCVPDPHRVAEFASVESWSLLFTESRYLGEMSTTMVLSGQLAPSRATPSYSVGQQTGHVVLHRDLWREVGGFNEEFRGWGYLDTDTNHKLAQASGHDGSPETSAYALFLYHPRPDKSHVKANRSRYLSTVKQWGDNVDTPGMWK